MAISTQQQSTLFKVFTGMFGAVPGGYYEELVGLTTAYGPKGMASILATSDLFKSIYPNSVGVAADFAQSFLTKTLGASFATANAEAFANDKAWLAANIEANGVGNAVFDYLVILDGLNTTTSPIYAAAQTSFFTQAVNAKTYLDNGGTSKDLSTLTTAAGDAEAAAASAGQTFNLTKGVNDGALFTGTTGNDTFNANYDAEGAAAHTLGALDVLNGGDGTDTLAITSDNGATGYTLAAATISNIETMTLRGSAAVTADVSGSNITGLTSLSVTQATVATLTASATTAVSVSGISAGAFADDGVANETQNSIVVSGGSTQTVNINNKAISVSLTDAAGAINVTSSNNSGLIAADTGGNDATISSDITTTHGTTVTVNTTLANTTATAAYAGAITVGDGTDNQSGAVSITQNLTSDGDATLTGGAIAVNGGTTVNVTVNATSTAATDDSDAAITVGNVTVTGDGETTAVTVTQNDTTTTFTTAAVAAVADREVVTFVAMATGESVTVNGLTFTASKALTAAEAAAAFADLTVADTQDNGGKVANGIYTGSFDLDGDGSTDWTSAAASGATVTFTGADNTVDAMTISDTTVTGTVTSVPTAGTAAVAADTSTNAITLGDVTIDDDATAAITTITLDGFDDADLGTSTALDALTTLSLTNSTGATTVDTNVTTLALTVNDITSATITLDDGGAEVENLTITATAAASDFALTAAALTDLTINAAVALDLTGSTLSATIETVDVNGAGAVTLGDISTEVALNTFDASGNTGGVTATIETDASDLTGDIEEYVFSAGADAVTLQDTTVSVKVTTGAGNDTVTLASGTTTLADVIDGGTDTDTLHMVAANAVTASGGTTFETKITGFEKLSLASASATGTVNLANMDDISYVVSANSTGGAVAEVQTFTITHAANAAVSEVQTVALSGTASGAVTFLGAVVAGSDTGDSVATTISNIIADKAAIITTWNGANTTKELLDISYIGGTSLTLTYKTTEGDVAIVGTSTSAGITFADSVETTAGDTNAGNITIEGIAVAIAAGDSIDTIGAAIAAANYAATTIDTVTYNAATDTVTVTYDAGVDEGNTTTVDTASVGVTFGAVTTTTTGAAAGGAAGLTLDNMANDGTLELTTAGAGVIVTMDDATGDADTFNIIVSDSLTITGINVGSVTVDDVETVDVTVADTVQDADENGIDDTNAAHTLTVDGDAVVTLNVTGAGDITLATTSTVLETVAASTLTGKLTYTASIADLVVTTGSGADVLTANADSVVLNGGNGANTFTVNAGADLVTLTGGTGVDTFNIAGASTTESTYATISAVTSGDTIKFTGADSFASAAITLSAGATVTSQALMDKAINDLGANDMGWFTYNGNTFIVMDAGANGAAGFVDNEDMVVMIAGTVDLSTASYNATSNTIEIA